MIWKAYCSRCRKVIFASPDLETTKKEAGDHAIGNIHMVKVGYQTDEGSAPLELDGVFFSIWEMDPEKMGHLLYYRPHYYRFADFLNFLEYEYYREDVFDDLMKEIEGGTEAFALL